MSIYKTARFQIRSDEVETAKQAVREFVDYIKANEPDTLIYSSVQAADDDTTFLHFMGFRDAAAEEKHRTSPGVMRFVEVLYPLTVDGVQFTDYVVCATTTD